MLPRLVGRRWEGVTGDGAPKFFPTQGRVALCRAGMRIPGCVSQQAAGMEEKGPEPPSSSQSVRRIPR